MNKIYLFFAVIFVFSSCLSREERTILNDLQVDKDRVSISKIDEEYFKNLPLIKKDLKKIDTALANLDLDEYTYSVLDGGRYSEIDKKVGDMLREYQSKYNRAANANQETRNTIKDTSDLLKRFTSLETSLALKLFEYYGVSLPIVINEWQNLYLVEVADSVKFVYDLDEENKKIEKKTVLKDE